MDESARELVRVKMAVPESRPSLHLVAVSLEQDAPLHAVALTGEWVGTATLLPPDPENSEPVVKLTLHPDPMATEQAQLLKSETPIPGARLVALTCDAPLSRSSKDSS